MNRDFDKATKKDIGYLLILVNKKTQSEASNKSIKLYLGSFINGYLKEKSLNSLNGLLSILKIKIRSCLEIC
jgi:hypothetical protein